MTGGRNSPLPVLEFWSGPQVRIELKSFIIIQILLIETSNNQKNQATKSSALLFLEFSM